MNRKEVNTEKAIQAHEKICNETRSLLKNARPGPWLTEPDRWEWKHRDFPCLLVRHPILFHWCGYVGVELNDPAFERRSKLESQLDVHGGITHLDRCNGAVCHLPGPDEPDSLLWIGFDCAHWIDFTPGLLRWTEAISTEGIKYRPFDWVKDETEHLAEQLYRIKKKVRKRQRPK